jgi:uncharacterized protein YbjT (DUF2867 family)
MVDNLFVTGATGYIGGRLVPKLLDDGNDVVVLTRSFRKVEARHWSRRPRVHVVKGDVSDERLLVSAMRGCGAAFYLVHSMEAAGRSYADVDRRLAQTFARVAQQAGVARIIYLGGLGETGRNLSEHLSSRREVESALASTSVPVTTLRAAMIIGSGSASFEILRYLVERLPVMVTPKWVRTECQPVAVQDVLFALAEVLRLPETAGRTYDIGGADVMTYLEIMQTMAEGLGLRRRVIIPVPVLTPRLSSLGSISSPRSVTASLDRSPKDYETVSSVATTFQRITGHRFLGVRQSIELALASLRENRAETTWSDAGVIPGDPDWAGGTTLVDQRTVEVQAPSEVVFRAVARIGGPRATTRRIGSGGFAACSIAGPAGPVFGEEGVTPTRSLMETPSTSGASRASTRIGGFSSVLK